MSDFNKAETIAELTRELELLQSDKVQIEQRLKEIDENIKQLTEIIIPDKMFEFNLSSLKLKNGKVLEIKEEIFATILKEKYLDGLSWLKSNGFEDLIKSEIKVNVGKNNTLLNKISTYLINEGVSFDSKEAVHPQTLKAFVKEQLKHGTEFPDSFSIAEKRIAKLK
jgi:hypothetical protein